MKSIRFSSLTVVILALVFMDIAEARFLSVDPVKGEVRSCQSWNRYIYVRNNPLKYVDPNGQLLMFSLTSPSDAQSVENVANSGLFGVEMQVDDLGMTTLNSTDEVGPPSPQQAAMADTLSEAITDSSTVTIKVENGTTTIIGSALARTIDVADMQQLGSGPGPTQAAALAHEVKEQFDIQIGGASPGQAHTAGVAAAESVSGWARGAQNRSLLDGSGAGQPIVIPYTNPQTGQSVTIILDYTPSVVGLTRQ